MKYKFKDLMAFGTFILALLTFIFIIISSVFKENLCLILDKWFSESES